MSEKIYAWLLSLYPAGFRRAYGDEALQLVRDRVRDERGFLGRLRLWLDLLGDLTVSVPREHRAASRAVAVTTARPSGMPGFHSLEVEALSSRSLLYGTMAALVVYGSLLVLLGQGGRAWLGIEVVQDTAGHAMRHMPTPTITLSSLPGRPVSGALTTITVTVGTEGGPVATGGVRFYDLVTVLGMGELKDGAMTIQLRLPEQEKHLLRATYLGDATYAAASSTSARK